MKQVQMAIAAARVSTHQFRMGAVLFRGAKIISVACNSKRFCGYVKKVKEIANFHAEIAACHNVPAETISGSDILVVRIKADDTLAMAKPCKFCLGYLREKNIRRIYFSNKLGEIERLS